MAAQALAVPPIMVADAGFMYVAKMSGYADAYDLFTPDLGELAFLADEKAPHPFYTRGFLLAREDDVPPLLQRALEHDHVVHFYHLHALDFVDVANALQADPAKAAKLAQSISPRPAKAEDFAAVQAKLKTFIESGQLGPFTNAYFLGGHPSYYLEPEANLVATAHYLEALRAQVEIAKGMGNEDILKLRGFFEDRRLTWNALYKAWDSAFSDRIPSADESTLTKILSDRAAKEARALEYFDGSNCLPLYHELENRSFREILPYIRTHYRLNLERLFEKYEYNPEFVETLFSLCEMRMKKLEKKRSVTPSQIEILHQVLQEDIFARVDSWAALIEYVTLLVPKDASENSARNIHDTDNLYDALMALQIIRYEGRKKYPISQITTCSLCWRVADTSNAKKKDKARCHDALGSRSTPSRAIT